MVPDAKRILRATKPRPDCIYCGGSTASVGKRGGEHVLPDALGPNRKIKCVCGECNKAFSALDKELTSRSILGALVRQVFRARGELAWGYSEELDVALEARALPGFVANEPWPQLILMPEKEHFYFCLSDAENVGAHAVQAAFWKHLQTALAGLGGEGRQRNRFVPESIQRGPDRGHYPPRVYTEHTFAEFRSGMQFKCRYLAGEDWDRILYRVRKWRPPPRSMLKTELGPRVLKTLSRCQPQLVLRALVKVAINLLADHCGTEKVNRDRFGAAAAYARYGRGIRLLDAASGFVHNEDVRQLRCPVGSHRVVLRHNGHDQWVTDFAFFDGRLGARVAFPGPQVARWSELEITAPYAGESRNWERREIALYLTPPTMRIVWTDAMALIPSLPQIL